MKYTVKLEGQYLKFSLDRQVSTQTLYRAWTKPGGTIGPYGTSAEAELCDAIANTPGVIKSSNVRTACDIEHILLEGDKVSVKVITIGPRHPMEIATQIVKKIQRRVAKGESRKRVKSKDMDAIAVNFNKNF